MLSYLKAARLAAVLIATISATGWILVLAVAQPEAAAKYSVGIINTRNNYTVLGGSWQAYTSSQPGREKILPLQIPRAASSHRSLTLTRSPTQGALAASSDEGHTCFITAASVLYCWGVGERGRLGLGNENDVGDNESPFAAGPVNMPPGRSAVRVSTGSYHTCVVLDNGGGLCWGNGFSHRLGTGSTDHLGDNEPVSSLSVLSFPGGASAVDIGASSSSSCVLLDTGNFACWGSNSNGRLGRGNTLAQSTAASATVVQLPSSQTTAQLSVGSSHACVLSNTGSVICWGNAANGRLGYGTGSSTSVLSPGGAVSLPGSGTAVHVSAGNVHTCAVLTNGDITCWGSGADGRLGYGSESDVGLQAGSTPSTQGAVQLPSGESASSVSVVWSSREQGYPEGPSARGGEAK